MTEPHSLNAAYALLRSVARGDTTLTAAEHLEYAESALRCAGGATVAGARVDDAASWTLVAQQHISWAQLVAARGNDFARECRIDTFRSNDDRIVKAIHLATGRVAYSATQDGALAHLQRLVYGDLQQVTRDAET